MFKYTLHLRCFGLFITTMLFFSPTFTNAQSGTIGDYVWNDLNSNGIQDAGEPGMANVFVVLQDGNGIDLDFAITDANGKYSLTANPGWYRLKFAHPGGAITPSPADAGNDNNDSDQDFLGYTAYFTLSAGENNNSLDAGFMDIPPGCMITVTLLSTECHDDGTFSIKVLVEDGNPWGWTASDGQTGYYGDMPTFGPFPKDQGEVCISFVDMDNPDCTGEICVNPPPDDDPCIPIEDPGIIGGDESNCGPYNPGPITNLASPTGGSGNIEYMWLASKNGCPDDISQRIFGANGPTYDPPVIFQTMYYVRWARIDDCPMWTGGKSNCVVKEVQWEDCDPICETRMVMNTYDCEMENEYAIRTPGLLLGVEGVSEYWSIIEGQMTEMENGTAKLLARLKNNLHPDMFLEMDVNLSNRTFHPQPGSPLGTDCYDVYDSDWYYYKNFSGTISGTGAIEGGRLSISGSGPNFQIGTGANLEDNNSFGSFNNISYTVSSQPSTSIKFYKQTTMSLATTVTGGVANCFPDGNCCENDKVLLVVGDLNLNTSDNAVRNHLLATGYKVDVQLGYTSDPWDAMGYGLVVISSTGDAAFVDGTFTDVKVPVLTYESWVYDNMHLTEYGNQYEYGSNFGKYINVYDDTHPTSAGRNGMVKVYNLGRPISWGMPKGDATDVAYVMGYPNQSAIFAYETGDEMADGFYAPARRVGFFLGNQAAHRLTDEGWGLFDAAVAWAIDCGLTTTPFQMIGNNGNFGNEVNTNLETGDFYLYPNPTSNDVFLDLSAYEGERVSITIFNQVGMAVKHIQVSEAYGTPMKVDLSALTNGYHMIRLETDLEGLIGTRKLLIRK